MTTVRVEDDQAVVDVVTTMRNAGMATATVVLALVAAKLLHKRLGADVEPLIWRVLVLSLLATRLGFVLEFAALYADAPLEVLNVRDGGWEPVAGWAAAWACWRAAASRAAWASWACCWAAAARASCSFCWAAR